METQPADGDSWILEGHSEDVSCHSSDDDLPPENDPSSSKPSTSLLKSAKMMRRRAHHEPVTTTNEQPLKARRPRAHLETDSSPQFVMPSMTISMATNDSWVQTKRRAQARDSPTSSKHPVDLPSNTLSSRNMNPHRGKSVGKTPRGIMSGTSIDTDSVNLADVSGFFGDVLGYTGQMFRTIFGMMRPVFASILALWIIIFLVRSLLTPFVTKSLEPLCSVPGVSWLEFPFCTVQMPHGPIEFERLMSVQSAFEDVLASSAKDAKLPIDMKRSESSIRDLRYVVQYSTLPSRNELVFEFVGFLDTARQASADLSRFNSRVGRSVDQVVSTNKWTLQVLDDVADKEAARGSLSRFLGGTIFAPFQSMHLTEHILLEQYLKHTRAIEDQIAVLVLEAQALLGILQNLDDRLDLIQGIVTRDGIKVQGSRDELFSHLWTKLGGNRDSRKRHEEQLRLLREVNEYRKLAWDHVSSTILKLQAISAGLEDLRERVATPELAGGYDPLPLRMHIEHIQLGVDRLEQQRIDAKRAENDQYRLVLDKGRHGDEHRYIEGQ